MPSCEGAEPKCPVHRPPGTPARVDRRPHRAGLLTSGSMPLRAAFPDCSSGIWHADSPVTVAGAVADSGLKPNHHRIPYYPRFHEDPLREAGA